MMKLLIKRIPIIKNNPYLATFFGVSFVVFIFGLIFFVAVYFMSSTEIVTAQEPESVSSVSTSIMEVHIANNGMVLLRGAKVESVSGTSIMVSTSWDNTKLQWTINTNGSDYGERHFGTNFFDSKGNKIDVKDLHKGNIISVSGVFNTNEVGLTVKADTVRVSY
ncbi:MAG TPA: hypothetical protein DEV73_03550 [Candidatus Zambryskibacteria bacterium]|nr:hypothetical protein [Candidatus Zambryskibacteria bacterium]HBO17968.1 hypothetical protein [Candidatus Zambryskibacteria bacterium]HCH59659.1 hypothetical protein [Candidatus Zambryskibacteria bacterium]